MVNELKLSLLEEKRYRGPSDYSIQSPSQFSREYSRLFGAPPLKDINSLRHMPAQGDG